MNLIKKLPIINNFINISDRLKDYMLYLSEIIKRNEDFQDHLITTNYQEVIRNLMRMEFLIGLGMTVLWGKQRTVFFVSMKKRII
jgi:hypothetical protein